MKLILNVTDNNDLNEDLVVEYNFENSLIDEPMFRFGDGIINENDPEIKGFVASSSGTAGQAYLNKANEVLEYETLIFTSEKPISNIQEIVGFKEIILGDDDLLEFNKTFRYSFDNLRWSDWFELTIDNLKDSIANVTNVYIEFQYVAKPRIDFFNYEIQVDQTNKKGWFKVESNGEFFIIEDNYPKKGTIKFTYDSRELDSNSILFGKEFTTANSQPKSGDFIFLNTLFLGLENNGVNKLKSELVPRVVSFEYQPKLILNSVSFVATRALQTVDSIASLTEINQTIILKPDFILKAFSFTGFDLIAYGITNDRKLDIQYRYSSNKKKWSHWIPLTTANLKGTKPDPLSFFYLEVAFTRKGEDESGEISIEDLLLYGDYQNVTNDYQKINRLGLRCDCDYGMSENDTSIDYEEVGEDGVPKEWIADECEGGSFNPYNLGNNLTLYNKLSKDVSDLFGWSVEYYRTDPDGNGTDRVLHEYQLYNVVDKKDVKILVPDNKFPENMAILNEFDLALFESFEIHITKEEFKNKFGIEFRPAKKDFMFLCQINRMYTVEHSQAYRDFMNSSVYYKVVINKYEDYQNVDNGDFSDELTDLTKNNSLDNLFGDEVKQNEDKVVNKPLQENLTEEVIRLSINVQTVDYELQNGPNIIATNFYKLISRTGQDAIVYKNMDTSVEASDDRTITAWFNIEQYVSGRAYNIISNYDENKKLGYKLDFVDGNLVAHWNENVYSLSVNVSPRKWYGVVFVFDNKKHTINYGLYSTRSSQAVGSATSSTLEEIVINSTKVETTPEPFNDKSITLKVTGSEMILTNIRVFKESIGKENWNLLLNQYIVKDTSKLLIADNANRTVISPEHKF